MDPKRASVLVAMLLADIVPGELAVVRMLDLHDDQDLLPREETGEFSPCPENPKEMCESVVPKGDWDALVREMGHGALVRPARGDEGYKRQLDEHLQQNIDNTYAHLAFRAAEGFLTSHGPPDPDMPRFVIWLTDGRPQHPEDVHQAIRDLKAAGAVVKAIVFAAGETEIARSAGLAVENVEGPAATMDAFADLFRGVVQAPFATDGEVARNPSFEICPFVDEAWVVVYGDDTLGDVAVESPDGSRRDALYAKGHLEGAGAYKVAFVRDPPPGPWTVHAAGGGQPAYAVVQRVDFRARPLPPVQAMAGARTRLEAEIRDDFGNLLTAGDVPEGFSVEALVDGLWVRLQDDGSRGDRRAGDGLYSAFVTFPAPGIHPVEIRSLFPPLLDRRTEISVEVAPELRYDGEPLALDFEKLKAGESACRSLRVPVDYPRPMAFELRSPVELPPLHRLEMAFGDTRIEPSGASLEFQGGDEIELCLHTLTEARSTRGDGHEVEVVVAGTEGLPNGFAIQLDWEVREPGFFERYRRELGLAAAFLAVAAVGLGFWLPHRFPSNLAIVYVPDPEDLNEQPPQPVRSWSGLRSGLYRSARAFLHRDFRLSPQAKGSLAEIRAQKSGVRVVPSEVGLYRETLDGEWEAVPDGGRVSRPGESFRVGGDGPFFRLTLGG